MGKKLGHVVAHNSGSTTFEYIGMVGMVMVLCYSDAECSIQGGILLQMPLVPLLRNTEKMKEIFREVEEK